MKRLGFFFLAALVAIGVSNVRAQTPTPAPAQVGVPQAMPMNAAAQPIPGGAPMYDQGGGAPMMGSYPGGDCGGYCGNGGYCGDGAFGGGGPCGDCYGGPAGGGRLCARTGRGYMQIDALLWHRGDAAAVPLVNSGGAAVLTGMDPYFGFETLPRLTLGYVLPNDTAIEATYYYKDDFDAWAGAAGPAGTLTINDPAGSLAVNAFTTANLNLATRLQNLELNVVETGRYVNWLAGFRYLEIQDRLRLYGLGPGGSTFEEAIDTYNSMFGGQAGVRTCLTKGLFTFETQGKAGLFFNSGNSHTTIAATGFPGSAPAGVDGDCESFVGELGTTLTFRPTAAVAFRLGYQVMWICNTALAVDQIDPNNPILFTGTYLNDRGDLVFHGPSAGLDVRW